MKKRMTHYQFIKRFSEATTGWEYSQEHQGEWVRVACLNGERFEGRTWYDVAKKIGHSQ